jgi:predicted transcriptional regulator
MPIIPAQPQVEPKDTLSLRLDRVLHERLKQYCQFIESPKDYVISQALRQLFRKDR